MHLVGFIIRIFHDARSPERQIDSIFFVQLRKQKNDIRSPILFTTILTLLWQNQNSKKFHEFGKLTSELCVAVRRGSDQRSTHWLARNWISLRLVRTHSLRSATSKHDVKNKNCQHPYAPCTPFWTKRSSMKRWDLTL